VRSKEKKLAEQLSLGLESFSRRVHPMPGIEDLARRESFVGQLIESIRRIRYTVVIAARDISPSRADPRSDLFEPLKAAILHRKENHFDEACWLVFLSVHFGKNRKSGWRLLKDVYGKLGHGEPWTWARVSSNPGLFRAWLREDLDQLKNDGIHRAFGNHRKYQSLDDQKDDGTGAAVESYVRWVGPAKSHQILISNAGNRCGGDPRQMFDVLYRSMDAVVSFGRMGKFDYLTMLAKLGLASIEPGSTYMGGSTGPIKGARLLFSGNSEDRLSATRLDSVLIQLGNELCVGMQVLEDALCNWQKSPSVFKPFRG
jgi:hypothetical protein